jgi:L-rhamnose isomerase
MQKNIYKKNYEKIKKYYRDIFVDTDEILSLVNIIPISIHCWQGDDLIGFEKDAKELSSGGILATGNYPYRARNIEELQSDIDKAFSLIPGKKKLALHASYGYFKDKKVDRDKIEPEHFLNWIDWAKNKNIGLDFNPTFFSHPKADSGYTLTNTDKGIRDFWIEHLVRSREISSYIGEQLGSACINNIWIPDGGKDKTACRSYFRELLIDSLDKAFRKDFQKKYMTDSLESKLFGIGSESFVAGSHEFYLSYAIKNNKMITFDTGHFHPTELVSDKISAVLPFISGILLHISRGVRWDSDHVPILSEELISIMAEITRANAFNKVHIGTDFFDASINRVGAWVIGGRAVIKAMLIALLEPTELLKKYELDNKKFEKLALFEAQKTMPFESVWNYYLEINNMPSDLDMINEIKKYETKVMEKRS